MNKRDSDERARDLFNEGDIVVLKSGGPDMAVKDDEGHTVVAQWFSGKKLEYGRFAPGSLKLVRKTDEDAQSE